MLFEKRPVLQAARVWLQRAGAQFALLGTFPLKGQRIIQEFREAGAITPPTAQPFRAHSRAEERAFHYFFDIAVIRETTRGRYYLDERSLEFLQRQLSVPWW